MKKIRKVQKKKTSRTKTNRTQGIVCTFVKKFNTYK